MADARQHELIHASHTNGVCGGPCQGSWRPTDQPGQRPVADESRQQDGGPESVHVGSSSIRPYEYECRRDEDVTEKVRELQDECGPGRQRDREFPAMRVSTYQPVFEAARLVW